MDDHISAWPTRPIVYLLLTDALLWTASYTCYTTSNNPDNCYCKRKLKISVLTKQEDIIVDLIEKLPDLQSKKDYLSKLKESLTQTSRFEIDLKDYKSTYNFIEITDKFKPNKPIIVTDLQIDINNVKNELKELKSENFILKAWLNR